MSFFGAGARAFSSLGGFALMSKPWESTKHLKTTRFCALGLGLKSGVEDREDA